MLIKTGEKLHLINHRRFERDIRRHFVGIVEFFDHGLARVSGYAFVTEDMNKHTFVRRADRRTKIASIASGNFIVNLIPEEVDIEVIRYEIQGGRLMVTDGKWSMDIKEFGWA